VRLDLTLRDLRVWFTRAVGVFVGVGVASLTLVGGAPADRDVASADQTNRHATLMSPLAVRRVISGDWRIAGFRVRANGTLGGAIRAFGAPASKRRVFPTREGCRVVWRRLGVRILFYNLGGNDPCSRRYGYFNNARIDGTRWRTGRGLTIRQSVERLRDLYPRARYHRGGPYGSGWWLVVRRSVIGIGGSYPGLLARSRDRRVTAFVVNYPAGGD
jgi:hypothetical protein